MEEQAKVICITCPKGCTLSVTRNGDAILKVEGAGCKRGAEYVEAETHDPRRMVACLHLQAIPQAAHQGIALRNPWDSVESSH